jgi:hypothetical protein
MRFSKKLSSQMLNSRVAFFGFWVLAAALLVPTFYQILNLVLYLGVLVINNPGLRPTGWTTDTLVGLQRCSFLVLGSLWIGLVMYFESYLSEGYSRAELAGRGGRILLIIVGTYLFSALILFVIG